MNTPDHIVNEPLFDIIISEAAIFWVVLVLIAVLTWACAHYRKPYYAAVVLVGIFPLSVALFLVYMFQMPFTTWRGLVIAGTVLEGLCLVGSIVSLQWALRRSAPLPYSALRLTRLGFLLLQAVGSVFTAFFLSGASLLVVANLFPGREVRPLVWVLGTIWGLLYLGLGIFLYYYKKPVVHSLWFALSLSLILTGFGCILALMVA